MASINNIVNEGGQAFFSGAHVTVSDAITTDVDEMIPWAHGLRLVGYAAQESSATPAIASGTLSIGATHAGDKITGIRLPASGSTTVMFNDAGIDVESGVSVRWNAGEFDLQLFWKII